MAMIFEATVFAALSCAKPQAIDGDTIKCANGERLRLSGIDTPEMPGHCRKGRSCVQGDPFAAKKRLQDAMDKNPVTYKFIKRDLYRRSVVIAFSGNLNLNCHQLAVGQYKPEWDTGKYVLKLCGGK